ncbi:phosphatase PAP2 family protein [Kitasatospora sp. P5_F3]
MAWSLFAVLAAVLAARGWAPFGFESGAVDWSVAHRPPVARALAVAVTSLGSGPVPYLVALAAGAVCARRSTRPRALLVLVAPVLWLMVGQLLRQALMLVLARPRPPLEGWAATASGYSFPSGHAFTSALCAGLLALALARRPGAVAALAVSAVAIGISRIYLGVHWPLDVLGSWLLAAGWLAVGARVLGGVGGRGAEDGTAGERRARSGAGAEAVRVLPRHKVRRGGNRPARSLVHYDDRLLGPAD